MKLYCLVPKYQNGPYNYENTGHTQACIKAIADRVSAALEIEIDKSLVGCWTKDEISQIGVKADWEWGDLRVLKVQDSDHLQSLLLDAGDPFSGKWINIKSIATCRNVNYNHDGHAFLNLRLEDDFSTEETEYYFIDECSEYLTTTDWMDGADFSTSFD